MVYLVAETSGFFEFEVFCGFVHFVFEYADEFFALVFGFVSCKRLADGVLGFNFEFDAVANGFVDLLGGDIVFLIVGELDFATAVGFVDRLLHGGGYFVCIHDDVGIDVTGRAPHLLNETGGASQEPLFIGVEDANE